MNEERMETELFDRILDEVVLHTIQKISEFSWEEMPQSLNIACIDTTNLHKSWVSMDIVDAEDEGIFLSAAGAVAVDRSNIPVAAWWTRSAVMRVKEEDGERQVDYNGLVVFGRTNDGRVNAAFISIEDDEPTRGKMFYAADDNSEHQQISTNALECLFLSAEETIQKKKDDADISGGNDLIGDLFKRVNGNDSSSKDDK